MDLYYREQRNRRLVIVRSENLDFPPHIHEDLELVYMEKGTCTAYCARGEVRLWNRTKGVYKGMKFNMLRNRITELGTLPRIMQPVLLARAAVWSAVFLAN